MASPLFIGVDAGGSKSKLRAQSGANTFESVGDGVNVQRQGVEHGVAVFAPLLAEALGALDHDGSGAICLGVAGAGSAADQHALADALRAALGERLGACAVRVEHDAHVALEAAFPAESGMIVIVGTGSVVLARAEDGAVERAGGWGSRIGDEGSGMAIGEAGLGAVAASFDGGEATALRTRLAETHGIHAPDDLIHAVYADAWPVQTLAPLVVATAEAGDWASIRILKTQANALAQRAAWLAHRVPGVTQRVALLGGLVGEAYYRQCLGEALERYLPGWSVREAERPPVDGALDLAARCHAETAQGAASRDAVQEIESGG